MTYSKAPFRPRLTARLPAVPLPRGSMLAWLNRLLTALADFVPPLLVCAVLAAVAYWGHTTGWQAKKFGALIGAADDEADDGHAEQSAAGPVAEALTGPSDWCEK